MGMWEAVFNIVSLLITSGYGLALIFVLLFVGTVYSIFGGMDSSDKRGALLDILGWPLFSISGWVAAILFALGARYFLKIQKESYELQIKALRQTKEEALTLQEKLPLLSGNKT